jgi:hypothetical protein
MCSDYRLSSCWTHSAVQFQFPCSHFQLLSAHEIIPAQQNSSTELHIEMQSVAINSNSNIYRNVQFVPSFNHHNMKLSDWPCSTTPVGPQSWCGLLEEESRTKIVLLCSADCIIPSKVVTTDGTWFDYHQGCEVCLTSEAPRPALGPPSLLFNGVKRPGREADHSRVTYAGVKNEWSFTSTASYAVKVEVTGQSNALFVARKLNRTKSGTLRCRHSVNRPLV